MPNNSSQGTDDSHIDGPRVSPLGDHTTRKATRETSQAVDRRPGQILEGHNLAEDSAIRANLEAAF